MAFVSELQRAKSSRVARSEGAALAIGVCLVGAAFVFDLLGSQGGLTAEGPPIVSFPYALRSAVLLAASAALVWGARSLALRLPKRSDEPDFNIAAGAVIFGTLIALVSVALLLGDPSRLSQLVREDHIVEWASALLAFLAGAFFVVAAKGSGRASSKRTVTLVVLGATCILLGLEEISWFQRVFDIEPPEIMLNRNGQKETNLHNLATGASGNLYYVGAVVYGVLIPALVGDRRLPARLQWLQPLVPSRLVLFGSATAAAYVYEMWNILWIQMTFWMTVAALWTTGRDRKWRWLATWLNAVVVVTAAAFLTVGGNMVRGWDDTELRELIIPFGLALAGLEAIGRIAGLRDGPDV